jgi:GTP cyclohydrolase I
LKNSTSTLDLTSAIFNVSNIDSARIAGELILKAVGENPDREGLLNTPQRFSKAIHEVCSGYLLTPQDAVGDGIFPGEGQGLVSIRDIDFFSLCEHHMLPFWGTASVAYYPNDKIIGLSKIPRLVDVFAKRLQVQERLTDQIASSLMTLINARAVLVKVSGSHMCMMMRGVKKTGSETITESSKGLENLTSDEKIRLWKSID